MLHPRIISLSVEVEVRAAEQNKANDRTQEKDKGKSKPRPLDVNAPGSISVAVGIGFALSCRPGRNNAIIRGGMNSIRYWNSIDEHPEDKPECSIRFPPSVCLSLGTWIGPLSAFR